MALVSNEYQYGIENIFGIKPLSEPMQTYEPDPMGFIYPTSTVNPVIKMISHISYLCN